MKGFIGNIEDQAAENGVFRRVVYTGPHLQLVLMTLQPGEDIGEEVHEAVDQFFRVEEGVGEVWIDGQRTRIASGTAVIVPAGCRHNIKSTSTKPLRLYTLYAPPHHADGTVHVTKAMALASEEHFAGQTRA